MAIRYGTAGSDNLSGTLGNDSFYMTADNFVTDTVNGGLGSDTVDYSASGLGVKITLTDPAPRSASSGGSVEADFVTNTYNPATHSFISLTHHQVVANLTNIENAVGSSYNDVLNGNGSANILNGGGGNDIIQAGAGNDTIIGGAGRDTVTGGSGNDAFVFQHAYDGPMSAATYAEIDTITDFVHGEDKIDLSGLVNETANHSLNWVDGGVFTGVAGQVDGRFVGSTGWLIQADLDGDRVADFQVMVHGTDYEMHQHFQLSDFILA